MTATKSREGLSDEAKEKIVKEALAKALKQDEDKKALKEKPKTETVTKSKELSEEAK